MRLIRLELRDFRGVEGAAVEFAPTGVTIVHGANEVGKSSLLEALDMLIGDPDSSSKGRVKATKPIDRDVGPWAQAVIETGPYRLTYAKRWVKSPLTELRVEGPRDEQLTGRAAHDRALEILGETMDLALFDALRHQQGIPLDQAALEGSGSLARALDAAAGAGTASAESDAPLINAIEEERAIWTTGGGDPNKRRKDLRDAAALAEDAVAAAQVALSHLDARSDEHRQLQLKMDRAAEREPDLVAAVADLEREQAELTRHEVAVRDLELAALEAEAPARDATQARAQRADLVAAAERSARAVDDATAEGAQDTDRLAAARAAHDEAAASRAGATAALDAAQEAFARAERDAAHLDDLYYVRAYGDRLEVAVAAEAHIADDEAFLAGCRITPDLLERIEEASVAVAAAEGRRDAAGAVLRVQADRDLRVVSGDGINDLTAGAQVEVAVPAGGGITIEGVARVQVDERDGRATTDAADAAEALGALLVEAGLASDARVEEARDLDRRRRQAADRVESQRAMRTRALDDLSMEELVDKRDRAERRVADYEASRDSAAPVPPDRAAAIAVRDAADAVRDAARRADRVARDALEAADAAVRQLEQDVAERNGTLGALTRRRDADADALARARADAPDAVLHQAVDEANAAAAAARTAAQEARAALDAADGETVAIRLDNAREALSRLRDDRQRDAMAAERLMGEITSGAGEGRADVLAAAIDVRDVAVAERDAAERQAAAVELLHTVMARHRDDAQRAYVAPFREAVERFGRLVFGGGLRVDVDHATLQVRSRTREGVTVPVESLSGGAREQLAVIGRLAAASLVATGDGDGAPVIIDDALGYSDIGRLEGLGAALAEAGRTSQVIVLTCMPDRYAGVGAATTVSL